jgi:hypothetical protein
MMLPFVLGLGFYAAAGGVVFKSLAAVLTGVGLMLGSGTILVLPSRPAPKPSH